MINRDELVNSLNNYFSVEKYGPDISMSRFIPLAYEGFNWQDCFTDFFTTYFNGLMISGAEEVGCVFGSVFPTEEVLDIFIREANRGDLLFLHHPIDMECGDPRGSYGRLFLPIKKEHFKKMKEKALSIYSLHHPLDCHNEISTGLAIAKSINLQNIKPFIELSGGFVGLTGEVTEISGEALEEKLKTIFDLKYLDLGGTDKKIIKKIAVVAGSGDKVDFFKQAEELGIDAYIAGEIHSHIDNEKGRAKMQEALDYMKGSKMSFFGISHAASEFLVVKEMVLPFIAKKFNLEIKNIPLSNWWH